MTNRMDTADAVVFACVASGRRATPTCPKAMDGATDSVEDNVRKRSSVDVVRGGSGTGAVLAPNRYRPGDVAGWFLDH